MAVDANLSISLSFAADQQTTGTPSIIVMDQIDDFNYTEIEPILASPSINHERMAADIVHLLLTVSCSACTIITVMRTKSVRSQLLGVVLINLAVAVLIDGLIITRNIEMEARAGRPNFGTLGCHLFIMGLAVSVCAINGSFIVLCLNSTFCLPQSRVAMMTGTFCIWASAIIFPALILYGIDEGPEVFEGYSGGNDCAVHHRDRSMLLIRISSILLLYYVVPSVFILVTLVRFVRTCRTNRSIKGKKLPFVLTAVSYLVLMWMPLISYPISDSSSVFMLYYWSIKISYYGRAVISLVWLVLIPDLRKQCLCQETIDEDSIELLE